MIIKLKGANFSNSNINALLNSWPIMMTLGAGATSSTTVTSVDKNAAYNTTITIADGYEIGSAGVTVTMGGTAITPTISGNTITISIAAVTGNVVIKVPTKVVGGGEEEPDTTNYTFTINPTPSTATVTLTASGYTQSGNSITVASGTTVNWTVSADGYATQTGSAVVTGTTSESVELVAEQTGTFDIVANLIPGYRINNKIEDSTSYSYTEPILMKSGELLTIETAGYNYSVICEVSSDGTYESTLVPATSDDSAADVLHTYTYIFDTDTYISITVKSSLEYVMQRTVYGFTSIESPTFTVTNGQYITKTGSTSSSSSYNRTSGIELKAGEILSATVGGNGMAAIATANSSTATSFTCQVAVDNALAVDNAFQYQYLATADCYVFCSYKASLGDPVLKVFSL